MPEQQLVVDRHSGPVVLQLRRWLRCEKRRRLRLLLSEMGRPNRGAYSIYDIHTFLVRRQESNGITERIRTRCRIMYF